MFSLLTTKPLSDAELIIRMFAAVLIGGIIGLEREYKSRPAGMRTHTLVGLGAATIAVLESVLIHNLSMSPSHPEGLALSIGRLSAQVVSGIGFLGAGTIFVTQKKIAGLTTAASVWTVACLGLLCGFGYYYFAILNCLVVIGVLFLQRIIHVNAAKKVEIRFLHRAETLPYISNYFLSNSITVLDIDFHVEAQSAYDGTDRNLYINVYTLLLPRKLAYADIVNDLSRHKNIQMVRTRNM